ncbi:probable Modin [Rhynchosporium agropyri]|uniref:Probable Modin n=1 Tax=Rhynchosporium agropyri TaxID=914238 RepID=A0A1E1KVK4_9HELO|nr:probable Modin [Rhynchosporium agropyri]
MTFDNVNQNVFGFTALIVSLVALVTTVMQVLQQYFSSAEGYRRCAESVMGQWAQGTKRKLRFKELRIEVTFETPVIFVAPPTNTRGPIAGKDIHYILGTDESYANTRVPLPQVQRAAEVEATSRVHTADDEKASWVNLLSALQLKEQQSRAWDQEWRTKTPPREGFTKLKDPLYPLAVGLQYKTRSWDFIPTSITKPYATSAICHLVEMMAMLGLYWKVFDQSIWNLRAEGNGFILTSTSVQGLGVMVNFATTGKSNFKENRVIPSEAVKELTFGTVPNIFDDEKYLNRDSDTQSLDLVFGTPEDVENTLESIGCQAKTLERYKKDHKHIFSVSFEIIGMLSKVFRLPGSNFRMLPNPTSDNWGKRNGAKASWKITNLMAIFQSQLSKLILTSSPPLSQANPISKISTQWARIAALGCSDEANLPLEVREAIHQALDLQTEYLLSIQQSEVLAVVVAHITKVVEVLEVSTSPLNVIVLANKEEALMNYYFTKIRPAVVGTEEKKDGEEDRNTIWIALIFRMLCWFLLHDFDKADAKIVPSDLKGSRMPIYIG